MRPFPKAAKVATDPSRHSQALTEGGEVAILEHMTKKLWPAALCFVLGCAGAAQADVPSVRPNPRPTPKPYPVPQPMPAASGTRDAVALARRDPEIAKMIVAARGGQTDQTGPAGANETAVQVPLSGQCGFAGCSSTTLVAFTFRSSGANTMTQTILALVSCPPIPTAQCTVRPAEVRAAGNASDQR